MISKTRSRRRSSAASKIRSRIWGCEACSDTEDHEWLPLRDLLSRLRLRKNDRRLAMRDLRCSSCDVRLKQRTLVALNDPSELTEIRRLHRWQQRFDHQFQSLESFLADFPGLGPIHPFGARLARDM